MKRVEACHMKTFNQYSNYLPSTSEFPYMADYVSRVLDQLISHLKVYLRQQHNQAQSSRFHFKIIYNLQMAYLSSPYGKTDSPSIKLSSRDAVDGINKKSSRCPYYKRINRYGSAFLKHIAKKQLCYKRTRSH